MADDFDVYHKWLGIPRHEQPANYYRLLGLAVYESDPEVIQHAADRQCAYASSLREDPHGDLVPGLLEELVEAADCLLAPARKRLYDDGLRAGQDIERRNPEISPPSVPGNKAQRVAQEPSVATLADQKVTISTNAAKPEPSSPAAPQVVVAEPRTITPRRSTPRVKQRGYPWITVSAGGLAAILVLVAIVAWNRGDTRTEPAARDKPPAPQAAVPAEETTADNAATASASADTTVQPLASSADSTATRDAAVIDATAAAPTVAAESDLPARPQLAPSVVASNHSAESNNETPEATGPRAEPAADAPTASAVDVTSTSRGAVLREVWRNVPGNKVDEFEKYIAEHPQPSEMTSLDRFESPEDEADNYGQRLRGFLFPPTTGQYTFTIRANAEGLLYLNDAEHSDQRRRILEGEKVRLEASRAYAVEAFHKESTGKDNFSVSWTLPDGTVETPIPGERLSIAHHLPAAHERGFVALQVVSATASAGSTLQVLEDGKILASGKDTAGEEYRITLSTDIDRLTGLRLEAMPHDSLPGSGPGRAVAGRFALGEISASLLSAPNSDTAVPLAFHAAVDIGTGNEARLIDGKPDSVWRGNGHGEPASVVLVLAQPLQLTADTQLMLTIINRDSLGCFRLLGTAASRPLQAQVASTDSAARDLFVLHANLGGEDYTAPDGILWRKSALFDNLTFGHEGGRVVVEEDVQNPVQGSAIRGIQAFRAVVPNGTYGVTLYFAEYWSTAAGSRRFSIAAEQRPVVVNFDLLQAAGFAQPFTIPLRNVVVRDERLDIDFQPATPSSSTLLNAIRIQQVQPPSRDASGPMRVAK